MRNKGFSGWYFKHQKGDDMIAFIPGKAESGNFVQMITPKISKQFDVDEFSVSGDTVRAGKCLFSPFACNIDLPGVSGEIIYKKTTPLRSDIMGPFRFFPMECRHGVISMRHELSGSIEFDSIRHNFDGGIGYIEKDSGTSFPRSYQWLQCNDFTDQCSIMVSIAHIPFYGLCFTGCICAVMYRGTEYRLATYKGVKIRASEENHIRLSQGSLLLDIDITATDRGNPLSSPSKGRMIGTIRERSNVSVRVRLLNKGETVFDLESNHAAYEYVPSDKS